MSTAAKRYLGYTPYKMDPKFRVSIPTNWRPASGEILYLLSSTTYEMPLIKVLSQQAFDERVKIVEDSGLTPAKKTAMLGRLYMLCREASVNEQGKLLIPKEISEQTGFEAESEVVLVGRGLHFEVWSKSNHVRVLEIEKTPDEVDDLGIL